MAFLTATQFTQLYDARRIRDFVSDTDARASAADITNPSTAAGAIVAFILEQASELIVAACSVAKKYTRDQLNGLVTSTTLTPSGYLLQRLTADLAFALLVKRRALPAGEVEKLAPAYAEAMSYLESLRRGDRIFFDVTDVAEAGLPAIQDLTTQPSALNCPTLMSSQTRIFGCLPGVNTPCCG